MKWKQEYLGYWIPDCNACKWLDITESEQQALHLKSIGHICEFYNTRVFHQSSYSEHRSHLYPCDKCCNDGCENFIYKGEIDEFDYETAR